MSLRMRVGVFLPGWPRLQMDATMSEEMITEASRVGRDRKRERERFQEKKSSGQIYGGSCLGGCSRLSINTISNKQPSSPGKHRKPSSLASQHSDIENIKSLSLYTHYQNKADYSTVGCSVLS